jgi:hypothetical protein
MHCYFVLAGDSEIPVLYHVERVREGRSFMTRTVQARQRGKCIFTTTLSFMREGSGGLQTAHHQARMPDGVTGVLEERMGLEGEDSTSPIESIRIDTLESEFCCFFAPIDTIEGIATLNVGSRCPHRRSPRSPR